MNELALFWLGAVVGMFIGLLLGSMLEMGRDRAAGGDRHE